MQNLRTVHMCLRVIVYNCRTQHSTEQFWLFFLLTNLQADNHHSSDAVYWSGSGYATSYTQQPTNNELTLM